MAVYGFRGLGFRVQGSSKGSSAVAFRVFGGVGSHLGAKQVALNFLGFI